MSATKTIISMGLLLLLPACAQPNRHAATDSREILRPKSVHSPYIATTVTGEPRSSRPPQPGEYRTYGIVDPQLPPPIASGPPEPAYAPAEVSPTGAHRTVIDQVTNQPVHYGETVNH